MLAMNKRLRVSSFDAQNVQAKPLAHYVYLTIGCEEKAEDNFSEEGNVEEIIDVVKRMEPGHRRVVVW